MVNSLSGLDDVVWWRRGDVGGVEEGIAREAAEAEKSKCAENILTAIEAKGYHWPFTRFGRWLSASKLRRWLRSSGCCGVESRADVVRTSQDSRANARAVDKHAPQVETLMTKGETVSDGNESETVK
jgi:hypothetical protein